MLVRQSMFQTNIQRSTVDQVLRKAVHGAHWPLNFQNVDKVNFSILLFINNHKIIIDLSGHSIAQALRER